MNQPISAFSIQNFLGSTVEAPLSTKPVVLPVGEYLALTKQVDVRQSTGKKETNQGVVYTFLEIPVEIMIPAELQEEMLRKSVTLTHSIGLDVTETGNLDMRKGANWRLGAFLEAINISPPWSPSDLAGKQIKVKIKHEMYQNEPQARIDAVGRAD